MVERRAGERRVVRALTGYLVGALGGSGQKLAHVQPGDGGAVGAVDLELDGTFDAFRADVLGRYYR